jgi:hypothetical protein
MQTNNGLGRGHKGCVGTFAMLCIASMFITGCYSHRVSSSHVHAFEKVRTVRLLGKGAWKNEERRLPEDPQQREMVVGYAKSVLERLGFKVVDEGEPADAIVSLNYEFKRYTVRETVGVGTGALGGGATESRSVRHSWFTSATYISCSGMREIEFLRSFDTYSSPSAAFEASNFQRDFLKLFQLLKGSQQ